jgi:UDP-N-acetylmuramoyl-L-alanyl-D-glutamate--2,6-diaminopimelate ligase
VQGYPARRLLTIGVTGTDGKTSLSHLLAHIFSATSVKVGLISTAESRIGAALLPDTGRFTTPEAPEVQAMLSQMADAGCQWAVIEATSHGLALHRVDECEFDMAVFTNLSSDHMDFHGSLEQYMAAKGRLFAMLDGSADKGFTKTAILNADDEASEYFRRLTKVLTVTYALGNEADFSAVILPMDGWASRFALRLDSSDEREVVMRAPGPFTAYNGVAATAVATAAGIQADAIVSALESWTGAPGRMERVDEGQPFMVVVDFAHSPHSLQRVLQLLREHTGGRLITVFGCIGERDKARRLPMGQVAAAYADYTIATDDNPYTEDRDDIITAIAAGLRSEGKREGEDFALIPDRREAIAQALAMAKAGDTVLLAGKGHEREVHLPDSVYPCHDATVARSALADLGHRSG